MVRQNIFEILKSKYDIANEINKINDIFNSNTCYINRKFSNKPDYFTIEQVVDEVCIHLWKQRGSCLNCKEIKDNLNIPLQFNSKTSIEVLIISLEYYLNIINLFLIKKPNHIHLIDSFHVLIDNINLLLEHINYQFKNIKNEEKVIIIPNQPEVNAVAETSSEETALAILMYNHHAYKGDIEGKRKLLYQIALEYEPFLSNPINGFKDFYEKANGLLNNLHIRHNNQNEEDNKNTIINLNEKELEKWYDELYQLILFCVFIKDNLERKSHVDEFLKSIKGAKGKAEELI